MRKFAPLAVVILALSFFPSLACAIGNVQKGKIGSWSSGNSWTVTINSTGSGNLITLAANFNFNLTVSSLSDNAAGGTNTYTDALNDQVATGNGWKAVNWYVKNCKSGATTVTIQLSGTPTFGEAFVEEWSGIDTVSPLDQKNKATASSNSPSSGNVTTTIASELAWGYIIPNSGTLTVGSSWIKATQNAGGGDLSEYQILTSTSTLAATATRTPTDAWTAQIVTFKGAGCGTTIALTGAGC
jgi:hypothetical protein